MNDIATSISQEFTMPENNNDDEQKTPIAMIAWPSWMQNLIVNLGCGGLFGALLYFLLSTTIPQMQETFSREIAAEREIFRTEMKFARDAYQVSVDRMIVEITSLRESNRQERSAFLLEMRKLVLEMRSSVKSNKGKEE